jgi:hypothetical protein
VLWIRIGFNADQDPVPAFRDNADTDPKVFDDQNTKKKNTKTPV